MKLSIIIVNFNVECFLHLCLKSVQKAIKNIDAEVIVVDNNSEDNSCEMVMEEFPEVVLIRNKKNYGFSKANNIGVLKATGQYICILNPDTVVSEDTFVKIIEFSYNKHKLGIVGCKLIDGNGNFLKESKRNVPSIISSIKKIIGLRNNYYSNNLSKNEKGKVDVLVGAFMFLERAVYHNVGGFDEDYFMYGEDIDLSYKILKSGYNNYYYGETSCIHFKGESTLRDKYYARNFYGAMEIFYKKHYTKNAFVDSLTWFGIKLAYFLRRTPKAGLKTINKYVFISNQMDYRLESKLQNNVIQQSEIKNLEAGSEVIFDANFMSYKKIIEMVEVLSNSSLTFKILPNKSNFIIGSHSSLSRGEVFVFGS